MNPDIIGTILSSLPGVIVSFLGVWFTFRLTKKRIHNEDRDSVAGAAGVIVDAAGKSIKLSTETVDRLEKRILALETESAADRREYASMIMDLVEKVKALVRQVLDLGAVPVTSVPRVPAKIQADALGE